MNAVIHYVLAILEGGLAGATFYEARKAKGSSKVFLHLASALFFVASLTDAMVGGNALKEAKTLKMNGGNDDE